ncbi:MAG TPA: glycosyltransferase [Candidatus Binataceae bacterium]|nr:glycosyltransferase [Candidatus Binataceae bacterium]
MLSVLMAHNYYRQRYPSGENEVFEAESRLLTANGHRVNRYVRKSDSIAAFSAKRRALLPVQVMWSREAYTEIRNIVAETRPDIAHFHNTFPLISVSALRACRELGVPVVQTLHNYRPLCMNGQLFRDGKACSSCVRNPVSWAGMLHRCYRGSLAYSGAMALMQFAQNMVGSYARDVDLFLAPSQWVRQMYIAAGYAAEKISVKPHFVEDPVAPYAGERQYALFVGRLSPEKGVPTLVAAWRQLPHIPLIVIGDGPQAEELKGLSEQLSNVTCLGSVDRAVVLRYIQRASCLIVPSEAPETFGVVAIEGLACGTPVIATKVGALPEIVVHDFNGYLFNRGDAKDLAARVEYLWTHRGYARKLGSNARQDYERRFTAKNNYEQLIREYSKVVESHS